MGQYQHTALGTTQLSSRVGFKVGILGESPKGLEIILLRIGLEPSSGLLSKTLHHFGNSQKRVVPFERPSVVSAAVRPESGFKLGFILHIQP